MRPALETARPSRSSREVASERRDRPGRAPPARSARTSPWARRNTWTLGLLGLLAILLVYTKLIQPSYDVGGDPGPRDLVLPLGFAAVAQAVAVIAGGIDLSIGSMMALTSVVCATMMRARARSSALPSSSACCVLGLVLGRDQRRAGRLHEGAGHRRHAGDVLRVGGLRAAGPGRPRRRGVALADGPGARSVRQPVDPEVGDRPADRRRRHLDPDRELRDGPVALRGRQQPAGRLPQRRTHRPDQDRRVRPDRPVLGRRRPLADGEHRHRDAGPGALHPR